MQIPEIVEQIIRTLQEHGYEAFAVGGCVRDILLNRVPEDWDITTSARPEQVKSLFRRTIDTGIQHGTVTIMHDKEGYEVTTYRIDGEYEDGRHPREVVFTADLLEDLRRRDFTINAMAYSPQTGIVDVFSGRADLDNRIIRCVGEPLERFSEDALRILRAIRFSAQLGFAIEPATWDAITVIAPNIAKVSKERIQAELTKLLLSDRPEQIRQVYDAGISPYVSPAFARLDKAQIRISSTLPQVKFIRWAAFLQIVAAEEAVQILKDLKLDNDTIHKVRTLTAWCSVDIKPEKAEVRRAMSRMEPEIWDALLQLKRSQWEDKRKNISAPEGTMGQQNGLVREQNNVRLLETLTGEIRSAGDCLSLSQLAVKGHDLVAAGMRPGIQIGETLQLLLAHVLEYPEDNQPELLLKKAGTASLFKQE